MNESEDLRMIIYKFERLLKHANGIKYINHEEAYGKLNSLLYDTERIEIGIRRYMYIFNTEQVYYSNWGNRLFNIDITITDRGYYLIKTDICLFDRKWRNDINVRYSFYTSLGKLKKTLSVHQLPIFPKAAIIYEMNNMIKPANTISVSPVLDALQYNAIGLKDISALMQFFIPGKCDDKKLIIHIIPQSDVHEYLKELI